MKIESGPVLCPHCGSLSAYYEIDKLSALRETRLGWQRQSGWGALLRDYKKKVFCLMCHSTIEIGKN